MRRSLETQALAVAIHEALNLWKDKVILVGFPGSVYALGTEAVKKYMIDLLKLAIPGERLGIEASTENLVSDENLLVLSNILEKATLPLSKEKINKISLASST